MHLNSPRLQFSANVLNLARKQRMNTEVRRNIFCVIMTSEDYLDAFEKLLRFVMNHFISLYFRKNGNVKLNHCWGSFFFKAFHLLFVQDGPEGQTREGDSSCSDGLLPSGENL